MTYSRLKLDHEDTLMGNADWLMIYVRTDIEEQWRRLTTKAYDAINEAFTDIANLIQIFKEMKLIEVHEETKIDNFQSIRISTSLRRQCLWEDTEYFKDKSIQISTPWRISRLTKLRISFPFCVYYLVLFRICIFCTQIHCICFIFFPEFSSEEISYWRERFQRSNSKSTKIASGIHSYPRE